ncbi:hypothetical protein GGF31_008172 [Allomyces arbusculus]|nr:hypothetical protein GGF31_008172 [Allomyces arbusculus]
MPVARVLHALLVFAAITAPFAHAASVKPSSFAAAAVQHDVLIAAPVANAQPAIYESGYLPALLDQAKRMATSMTTVNATVAGPSAPTVPDDSGTCMAPLSAFTSVFDANEDHFPLIAGAAGEYGLCTPARFAVFIGQIAHETARLTVFQQPADGGAGAIHMIPANWPYAFAGLNLPFSATDSAANLATMLDPKVMYRMAAWWFVDGAATIMGRRCAGMATWADQLDPNADLTTGANRAVLDQSNSCLFGLGFDNGANQRYNYIQTALRAIQAGGGVKGDNTIPGESPTPGGGDTSTTTTTTTVTATRIVTATEISTFTITTPSADDTATATTVNSTATTDAHAPPTFTFTRDATVSSAHGSTTTIAVPVPTATDTVCNAFSLGAIECVPTSPYQWRQCVFDQWVEFAVPPGTRCVNANGRAVFEYDAAAAARATPDTVVSELIGTAAHAPAATASVQQGASASASVTTHHGASASASPSATAHHVASAAAAAAVEGARVAPGLAVPVPTRAAAPRFWVF